MYLVLIILPLFGAIIAGLLGKKISTKGSCFITLFCLILSCFISIFVFYEVALIGCFVYIKLINWIDSAILNVNWGFLFDTLTVIMCLVVTFVSSLVHLYSVEYMMHDPHLSRFMSYLSLFTFFMLILITADNFIQMFVGWEGVGLCSYLLINFWFTRIQANKAAIKAMILNRIGDFSLIIGILIIFVNYKSLDYATVFAITPFLDKTSFNFLNCNFNLLTFICFFLFVGAVGKSAQLGLHTWLPDAMEGPTPVSALIHAATMVTAGIFLIVRNSPIYEFCNNMLDIITSLGAMTAFFAATISLVQNDLKKVVAYSTCSQLGYMFIACGLSNYSVSIFHLANHAFFKALLFLGAGSVIHAISDEQDIRKMGGLKKLIPFTFVMMAIGSMALIGFPFLAGFYSKELILETAFGKYSTISHFSYYLGTFGAFLTAFYSTRLLYLIFLSKPNGYKSNICFAYDSSYQISITLGLLALPSIFIGFYSKDMIVGLGTDFWGNAIFINPKNLNIFDAEFIIQFYKLLPICFSLFGILLAFLLYINFNNILFRIKISFFGKKLYNFLNKKWFFDKIYNEFISQFFLKISYDISYKLIDRGIFELFGPNGLSKIISKKGFILYQLQTGYIYHYTLIILISCTFFLGIRQFWLLFNQFLDYRIFFIFFISVFYFFYIKKIKRKK